MTTWKKKEEFSIFGKDNYNKCSSSSQALGSFFKYLKMGGTGLINVIEAPFIYTDKIVIMILLNMFYANTDCVKITDINLLNHLENDKNTLSQNPAGVKIQISKTITDISSNLLSISNENVNIIRYTKAKEDLSTAKTTYQQNKPAPETMNAGSLKQDATENSYDAQMTTQDNNIQMSNDKIDGLNITINKLKTSLDDYNSRLNAINLLNQEMTENPSCKQLRTDVLKAAVSVRDQIYDVLGIPIVIYITYNMYYILGCNSPYGEGSEPVILDIEGYITGKQDLIEDLMFGGYFILELILNAALYPFTFLRNVLVMSRSYFAEKADSGPLNSIQTRTITLNQQYPLIIFLLFYHYIFSLYSSGLYSQLWNFTIYGSTTKMPIKNSDGTSNINQTQTSANTSNSTNYVVLISTIVIILVWLGFVFRFPIIVIKALVFTRSIILAILAFVAFLIFTLGLANKVPLGILIYILVFSCISFLFQKTETNYYFFDWYAKDFYSHVYDIFNIGNREYWEKKDDKYTNEDIMTRTINNTGMFGDINYIIYKAIYGKMGGDDDECEKKSIFQRIYDFIQKGLFSNIFEISFIFILIGGIYKYLENMITGTTLANILGVLIAANVIFIGIALASIYVKHLIKDPILDKLYAKKK